MLTEKKNDKNNTVGRPAFLLVSVTVFTRDSM